MSININDINACKAAYVEYTQTGKPPKGVSANDIQGIEDKYSNQLKGWRVQASKDQNVYEIDDTEEKTVKGKKSKTGQIARTSADAVMSVGGAVGSVIGAKVGEKIAEKSIANATIKSFSFMIGCTMGLANGVLYQAKKPNKDEHNELMELEVQMEEYLSSLESEQDVMNENSEKIEDLSSGAANIGEEASENIEELQNEYDEKITRQNELSAKMQSGQPLTEEEKAEYEQLGLDIQSLGEKISALQTESSEEIEEINGDTENIQEEITSTSDKLADMLETADYAETFDSFTKTLSYVEAGLQGINAVSSTASAIKAFSAAASGGPFTAWAAAFGTMGMTGAAMSGVGVAEQLKYASDIGNEINVRESVQELAAQTNDIVEENVTALDETNTNIEELQAGVDTSGEVSEGETASSATTQENPLDEPKEEEEVLT